MKQLNSIMLVDDDSTANFLHEEILNDMGIAKEIIISLNGMEALEKIHDLCNSNKCPDLILLDINMPKMNGFEFLEKFYEMDAERKYPAVVVILTSSLDPNDVKKAKELNVKQYLSKPLEEEGINEIFNKYF